ncbi:arylesterase [Aliidiomarina halalkaliphila]|uniref:Arylesterase n=1 Tax=Aliidiomarina halalkaliphila TaxID=2593535 RepID=A0A552X500_9GAMM|nr:arylesterase [Aliidiomarina halalkaliphila]TRW50075.1 arylesterase [Aliidiomarina halalkaliphila]
MFKKFLYIIVVIGLAVSCSVRAADTNVSLLVLGDSLSAGYGIAEADTWVAEIDRTWSLHHPNLRIINASISGETTQGGLARLESLIDRHQPDIVFIELGGNDGLRGFNLDTMESNLREMVTILQSRNIQVALSEVEIPPNLGRRYTRMFRDVFHTVADDKGIPLIPFFMREVALNAEYMQADGIHPNLAAQPVIADIMEPQLRALLEAL